MTKRNVCKCRITATALIADTKGRIALSRWSGRLSPDERLNAMANLRRIEHAARRCQAMIAKAPEYPKIFPPIESGDA